MKIPFTHYNIIPNKDSLDAYQARIRAGYRPYGEPEYTPSPICDADALLVAFDEEGTQSGT